MTSTRKDLFPLVSADVALFSVANERLVVLLVKRANPPQRGRWALPGGVLKPDLDGSLEETARRILRDKTGLEVPYLAQAATYSGPDRDPRGWSVSVLFHALLPVDEVAAIAGSRTEAVAWAGARSRPSSIAISRRARSGAG